jgi:hypothetical protein
MQVVSSTAVARATRQMELELRMILKPVEDAARDDRVWAEMVLPLRDAYETNP